MKITVSEAIGSALDWLVAKTEQTDHLFDGYEVGRLHYSTDWSLGGPIIERERPMLCCDTYGDGKWQASLLRGPNAWTAYGSTPLVAAMRCFVASKLGDEVEVPEGLT